MSKKTITSLVSAVFVVCYILIQSVFQSSAPPKTATSSARLQRGEASISAVSTATQSATQARVTRVVDGDTIEIDTGQKVRYIGMNTPETVAPNRPVECYGHEASARNKALVEGKMVTLEKDVSDKDTYGRLLRYVWIGDTMINEVLVREGYAQVATYPPDVKYKDRFIAIQREAMAAERGLWGSVCNTPVKPK